MSRDLVEPIDDSIRRRIQAALKDQGIKKAHLALQVGVNRATISKILGRQKTAEVATLVKIADVLGIPREELRVQYELEFAIDANFAASAQKALQGEIERLRTDVGTIRAVRVSGVVGLRFHGIPPEERAFERVFALPLSERQRPKGRRLSRSA